MGGNPWDRNEGKFDVPSSAIPTSRLAKKLSPPATLSRAIAAEEEPRRYHGVEPVFIVVDRSEEKPRRKPTSVAAPKVGKRLR